jgi:DNA-directed RNA polymerase subunit L
METIKNIDYKIKKFTNEPMYTRLELDISGPNINYIVINTIRRTILTDIPIYAFTKFTFNHNDSIFHNNYLKIRFENMPVLGIDNNLIEYIKNNDNNSSLNQVTMFVDFKSTEQKIITVTTDDAKFYYNGKNIVSPYKTKIPLIDLQPNQSIIFSAVTTVGNEKENSIFSAVAVCYYKEINENKYDFIIESRGQLTEKRIIHIALLSIINNIEKLIHLIQDEQTGQKGKIVINNLDDTLGNLISYGMNLHKNINIAGYHRPHLLEDKIIISYELINEKINLTDVLNDVHQYFNKLFNKLIDLNSKI